MTAFPPATGLGLAPTGVGVSTLNLAAAGSGATGTGVGFSGMGISGLGIVAPGLNPNLIGTGFAFGINPPGTVFFPAPATNTADPITNPLLR